MSDTAVAGSPFGKQSDRPSRSFGRNRVCPEPGCGTRLSSYNPGKYCSLHEPMTVPRTRGKKIA